MDVRKTVARYYAEWVADKGASWTKCMTQALEDMAANHAIEMRAYEATVQNQAERISQLDAERVPSPSCRECANRGRVTGLSQETYCDSCVWQGHSFRVNQYAAAPQPKKEGE